MGEIQEEAIFHAYLDQSFVWKNSLVANQWWHESQRN